MKWLIWGKGWIYKEFIKYVTLDVTIVNAMSRADNRQDVIQEILNVQPDRIICLIGRVRGGDINSIDYLEGGRDKLVVNIRDNMFAVLLLKDISRLYNIHYTYVGTGCIFKNTNEHYEYTEDDIPNFFGSSYSIVKGYLDMLMNDESCLNIRMRLPITSDFTDKHNLISKIISYPCITDIPNSVSVIQDLFPCLVDMINLGRLGTFNFVNPGTITNSYIKNLYKKYIDPDHEYQIISECHQNTLLKCERSNNTLNTEKLCLLYPTIPCASVSIEKIFTDLLSQKSY